MGFICKNTCVRYKVLKRKGYERYMNGQTRCQVCDLFIVWKGVYCPCCGAKLRTGPRHHKYKLKLRCEGLNSQVIV